MSQIHPEIKDDFIIVLLLSCVVEHPVSPLLLNVKKWFTTFRITESISLNYKLF